MQMTTDGNDSTIRSMPVLRQPRAAPRREARDAWDANQVLAQRAVRGVGARDLRDSGTLRRSVASEDVPTRPERVAIFALKIWCFCVRKWVSKPA